MNFWGSAVLQESFHHCTTKYYSHQSTVFITKCQKDQVKTSTKARLVCWHYPRHVSFDQVFIYRR